MKKKFVIILVTFLCVGCGKKEEPVVIEEEQNEPEIVEKVDIIDIESKSRPFAVVINNSTAAVKVQEGLQQAYMVYEFPVEGGLTRLVAFYKDLDDLIIGTIRSARHNFLDYVFEQDAIFVSYGWSNYAREQMNSYKMDYINGTVNATAFWRDNPEGLASEHTAYTSIKKIRDYANSKSYRMTTEQGLVFNYDVSDINLSQEENAQEAINVSIPSNGSLSASYVYDEVNKRYYRFTNSAPNIDHLTKAQYTAKNIIIQKITYGLTNSNYYLELHTTGEGTGYFITNGYAIPIKWSKPSRQEKTKYTYLDGREVLLSDGNTFIQLQSVNQPLTISK